MFLLTMATMTLHFTVKNLAAEELRLHTSESMVTLSDLRRAVEEHWGLPAELQRFVCSGRNYWRHDGATPLSSVLDGTSDGPDRERLIWLMWMRKEDYTCAPDGGMFLQSEYEAKQALYQTRNKPFHPVTLGRFLALHTRSLSTWHTFHHGDSWIDNPIAHDLHLYPRQGHGIWADFPPGRHHVLPARKLQPLSPPWRSPPPVRSLSRAYHPPHHITRGCGKPYFGGGPRPKPGHQYGHRRQLHPARASLDPRRAPTVESDPPGGY